MGSELPSRIEVNAAIEALIQSPDDPSWVEHAQLILQFIQSVPVTGAYQFGIGVRSGNDRGSITGYTSEAGNVTIPDSLQSKREPVIYGRRQERVGHYKLQRGQDGRCFIHHFWKSDLTTSVGSWPNVAEYVLHVHPDGTPKDFGIMGLRPFLHWWIFAVDRIVFKGLTPESDTMNVGWNFNISY